MAERMPRKKTKELEDLDCKMQADAGSKDAKTLVSRK